MKIVHVMNWYIPDMGYQENFLPAEQQKLGHDVYIITSDRVPFYQGFENNVGRIIKNRIIGVGEFKDNDITIYRLPLIFEVKNGGIIFFSGLKTKLKELKPDVVHAHGPYSVGTLIAVLHCRKIGYKIFIDEHSHVNNYQINTIPKKIYIDFLKIFYIFLGQNVSYWMPVAEPAKKILQKNFTINENKIITIPLGISTQRFFPSKDMRESTRRELLLKDDDVLIISTGKFDDSKDLDILIRAFAKVIQKKDKIKLLIIGNGPYPYMKKIKDIVNEEKINNSIIFKDFVKNKNLPQYYNAPDLALCPGDHTITAVESLGVGLPIIVPYEDLSYKMLFDNQAALGFKRKNIESLANSIQVLMNNPDKKITIIENALSLVRNQLSWETIAKETILIYSESC